MRKYLRIALGCVLVLMGIVGLVVPVLQGLLLIALGVAVLYRDVPFLQKSWKWTEQRFPIVGRAVQRIRKALRRNKNP